MVKIRLIWGSSFLIIFYLFFFLKLCIAQRSIKNIIFLCNLLFLQIKIRDWLIERSLFRGSLILSTLRYVILRRKDRGFSKKNICLRGRFWSRIRARVWILVQLWAGIETRVFLRWSLLISFLCQGRCFLLGFTIRVIHSRTSRLQWNWILPRNVSLLNQRHARIFWGECSYKDNSCDDVLIFPAIAQQKWRKQVLLPGHLRIQERKV